MFITGGLGLFEPVACYIILFFCVCYLMHSIRVVRLTNGSLGFVVFLVIN